MVLFGTTYLQYISDHIQHIFDFQIVKKSFVAKETM